MAVNPVSLAEMLRPWRIAGITHFLGDVLGEYAEAADATPLSAPPGDASPASDPALPQAEATPARALPDAAPHFRQAAPFFSPPSGAPVPDAPARVPAGSAHPLPGTRETAPPASTAPDAEHLPRPRPWEEPWESLAARFKPAPLLWTYTALGLDLLAEGDKNRSACLRDMIGRLQLPKGSSTFWPLHVPEAAEPSPSSYFRDGLSLLRPQAVVMIGPDAPQAAGLPLGLHTPFTQEIFQGRFYLLLPDFAVLLGKPDMLDKACIFLRTTLSGLPAFLTR